MSCFIEKPPVSQDFSAEIIFEGLLIDHIDFGVERISQIGEESAEGEQCATIIGEDAENIVTVGAVVSASSGSEEIHLAHTVFGSDSTDYLRLFLNGVLSFFHDMETRVSLIKKVRE